MVQQPIEGHQHGGLCHKHAAEMREEIRAKVFQPGAPQPTMRLEDFANKEMAMMQEMEERNKAAAEREKAKGEMDEDKDEVSDMKTLEQRAWDDWADEHEKGGGNRNKN
jgi:immunoglobulin-binding protein 1